MSRVNQLFNQIIHDLEQSMLDQEPMPFSKYLDSANGSKVLIQKLIESHDVQIAAAVVRDASRSNP